MKRTAARGGRAAARPITDLAPSPANPRTITAEALAGLSASVAAFGDLSGIVLNRRSGRLVAGHQRVRALREAGATEWSGPADGGYVVDPRTGERFPVRVVDFDERTEAAANLTANNPAITGDFTADALGQLDDFRDFDGFEDLRLDALSDELRDTDAPEERAATERELLIATPPTMAWVLVGIPLAQFGSIAGAIEALAARPDTIVETTVNADDDR